MSTVASPTAAAITMAGTDTDSWNSTTPPIIPESAMSPPMSFRVTPMPPTPDSSPSGMPTPLMARASKNTELRICREVAPAEDSMPNCLLRSLTEMAKAL